MPLSRLALPFLFMMVLSATARAQDADVKAARALEAALQKVIETAEASVACVLVSRSELYQKLGQKPGDTAQGRLGGFDPAMLNHLGLAKMEREAMAARLDLAHPRHVPESFGSAVVIGADGLLLTNFHVVRDATKVYVRLPGGHGAYADIHAADARSDLAVLRLLDSKGGWPTLKLGEAKDLKRGRFLVALSNPFAAGFRDGKPSASLGILSNVRRRVLGLRKEEDSSKSLHFHGSLLQVDARISLGASGGALLDLDGEMVGLISAWAGVHGGDSPGGFAIPMDERFRRIVEVLKKGEEVEYGFLGIGLHDKDGEGHVTVAQVYPGSPAERARIEMEDRIVAVNGAAIENSDDLFLLLGGHLAGTKVAVDVVRPGEAKKTVHVTLAKFHSPGRRIYSSLGARPFVRGLRVDDAAVLVQQAARWSLIPPGVVVAEVQEGTAAEEAKLREGDVITQVGETVVGSPQQFYEAMRDRKGPVELTLYPPSMVGAGLKVTLK